ncbi:MAG: type II toxin-antitoxin system VapC family toxin [Actinobacteria bacterium]|nr:type II toxin-antitoxin system VapC family toxin [Actinomycetota bacterium]
MRNEQEFEDFLRDTSLLFFTHGYPIFEMDFNDDNYKKDIETDEFGFDFINTENVYDNYLWKYCLNNYPDRFTDEEKKFLETLNQTINGFFKVLSIDDKSSKGNFSTGNYLVVEVEDIKWFFNDNEENVEASHLILKGFINNEIGIITPEIALFELANIVKNKIKTENNEMIGMEIIDRIYNLGIVFKITKQVLKNAFNIALATNESVYDCPFIATAEYFNLKFITDDKKLYLNYENSKKNIKTGNLNFAYKTISLVLLKDYLKK